MQKYFDDVADKNGKPVTGATVLVLNYPAGTTATIYADNSFTALANPISTDTNGGFAFYARDGRYSLQINGPGIATRTINDILLEDPVDGGSPGSFTTLTVATSGTLAGSAIQTAASLGASGTAALIGTTAGNVQSDLNARPTNSSLAAPGTAANIGTAAGTVQTDIDARPTSSALAASGGAALVGFLQSGTGAVARTVQDKQRDMVSVFDFMTTAQIADIQAGTLGQDVTSAIANAHATGRPVFYPYGRYKHVGYFPACEGGIIGEGWSTATGAKSTEIVFYNCTGTQSGAITPKQTTPTSRFFRIENILISASSWDATTGCLGYGIDVGAPIRARNVNVQKFKRSCWWFHHVWPTAGSFVTAPYESLIENCSGTYSGEYGALVGYGANAFLFLNFEGKWNGAPSFGVAPSVAGSYDGLKIAKTADGNDIHAYDPEAVRVIGGDCSYNSGYGWNFDGLSNALVEPGYAEGNLTNQARCGDLYNVTANFPQLAGGEAGFTNAQVYAPFAYRTEFYVGHKRVHPADDYTYVLNPTAEDEASGTIQNAPARKVYLSRTNSASLYTYLDTNQTPDGTALNLASETATTLRGSSTYAIGIGSGSRHLKISDNTVRLPDIYWQATGTGWNASSLRRSIGTAAPTSGTWTRGEFVYNSAPSAAGVFGWLCVASGTPGTWVEFGTVAGAVTVATLRSPATAGLGGRSFVSDATATTFGTIVAGGGANNMPVYSDGVNWRIG